MKKTLLCTALLLAVGCTALQQYLAAPVPEAPTAVVPDYPEGDTLRWKVQHNMPAHHGHPQGSSRLKISVPKYHEPDGLTMVLGGTVTLRTYGAGGVDPDSGRPQFEYYNDDSNWSTLTSGPLTVELVRNGIVELRFTKEDPLKWADNVRITGTVR